MPSHQSCAVSAQSQSTPAHSSHGPFHPSPPAPEDLALVPRSVMSVARAVATSADSGLASWAVVKADSASCMHPAVQVWGDTWGEAGASVEAAAGCMACSQHLPPAQFSKACCLQAHEMARLHYSHSAELPTCSMPLSLYMLPTEQREGTWRGSMFRMDT